MNFLDYRDFDPNFARDFGDQGIDQLCIDFNTALDTLARNCSDPFQFIAENFGNFRQQTANALTKMVGGEVINGGKHPQDVVPEIIDAVIVGIASQIDRESPNQTTQQAGRFIDDTMKRNIYLRTNTQRQGGYGDRQRQTGRQTGQGGYGGGYGSQQSGRTYQSATRPTKRPESRPQYDSNGQSHGRMVPASQRPEPKPAETQQVDNYVAPTTINEGDVVTSENRAETGIIFAPAYIVGEEQVVFRNGKLEVVDYAGASVVDYEKHRVDLIFSETLAWGGEASTNLLTEQALRAAQEARDMKIKRFVEGEDGEEDTLNLGVFKNTKSATYEQTFQVFQAQFSPTDIRDDIIQDHAGSYDWFSKNAMVVNVDQNISVGKDNDAKLVADRLFSVSNYSELVKILVTLHKVMDAARWRTLHDYYTRMVNIILLRVVGLTVTVKSITADWNDLAAYIEDRSSVTEAQALLMLTSLKQLHKHLSLVTIEEEHYLSIKHTLVYIPVTTNECEIATPSKDKGIATLAANTGLHLTASKFYNTEPYGHLEFVTLDGAKFEIVPQDTVTSRDYSLVLF